MYILFSKNLNMSIEFNCLKCSHILLNDYSKESISSDAASSATTKYLKPKSVFFFLDVWKNTEILYWSEMHGTHKLKKQGALFSSLWSCSLTKFINIETSKKLL